MRDYFSLFGIQQGFDIDVSQLEKKYFALQREFHPDKYAKKPEKERIAALQLSTDINAGFNVLKSPLKRAEYILKLNNLDVNAETGGVKPSQELLAEMLEMRENLFEGGGEKESLKKNTEKDIDKCIGELKKSFEEERFQEAAQLAIRLKYLTKFIEEIKNAAA